MPNIKTVETFLFNPNASKNLMLCRVTADDGTYGWGEAYVGKGKEQVAKDMIDAMGRVVKGHSVFEIRHLTQVMFDDFQIRRSAVDYYSAWSAIEIALWDIVGKLCGQPVCNLLGGPVRDHIRVYANGWWFGTKSIEETIERCKKVEAMGFNAVKWDPFFGPWRTYIDRRDEDIAVEHVRAMREAFPKMDLMLEIHRRLSPYNAIRFAERTREFDPFVFEEPCLSDNKDLLLQVKQGAPYAKIVTGETCYTKAEFKEIFEKHCADIINPDTCVCNGILGMTELAAMCEPYCVEFSPHNYNSTTVGLAATVHISAVAPTFNIAELFVNLKDGCDEITTKGLTFNGGYLEVPNEPGLGIDIDVDKLLAHTPKDFPAPSLTPLCNEYPSKALGHGGRV